MNNMNKINKNDNFFKKIKKSIFNFEEYEKFANENILKCFNYILKLLLIFAFFTSMAYTYISYTNINKIIETFNNSLPDFKIEKNLLIIENKKTNKNINIKDSNIGIILNSKETKKDNIDISKNKNNLLLLKDKMIINYENKDIVSITYKDFLKENNIKNLSKTTILEYINNINIQRAIVIIFFITIIPQFVIYLLITLIDVTLLSILGFLISKVFKVILKYKQIFKISIYALTLPIILSCIYIFINILTGFTIKYFQTAYNIISYIYLITVILTIKSDLIKIQTEILTIEQEIKEEEEKRKNKQKNDKQNELENKSNKKQKESSVNKEKKNKLKSNKKLKPQDSKA